MMNKQRVADQANTNRPLRMYIALKMLRAFALEAFDYEVACIIEDWIDCDMKGPIPFPRSPLFKEWADKMGFSNIDGSVGFLLKCAILDQVKPECRCDAEEKWDCSFADDFEGEDSMPCLCFCHCLDEKKC